MESSATSDILANKTDNLHNWRNNEMQHSFINNAGPYGKGQSWTRSCYQPCCVMLGQRYTHGYIFPHFPRLSRRWKKARCYALAFLETVANTTRKSPFPIRKSRMKSHLSFRSPDHKFIYILSKAVYKSNADPSWRNKTTTQICALVPRWRSG